MREETEEFIKKNIVPGQGFFVFFWYREYW